MHRNTKEHGGAHRSSRGPNQRWLDLMERRSNNHRSNNGGQESQTEYCLSY